MKFRTAAVALAIGVSWLATGAMAETIGIAMPTKSSARWIDDGNNMVKQLQEAGYDTDLQYAEDDIPRPLTAPPCRTRWKTPPPPTSRSSPMTG